MICAHSLRTRSILGESGSTIDSDLVTKSDPRKRSSEVIFEELALAILGGELKPGTPLESERTLGVRFAASRSTIREAVHKLGDARACPA